MNYMNKHEFFYKMDYEYLYYIMYVYTGNVKTSSSVCKSDRDFNVSPDYKLCIITC